MARWPELEMGRNSATPCTSPNRKAVKYVIAVPHVRIEYKWLYCVEILLFVIASVSITRILYHKYGKNATGIWLLARVCESFRRGRPTAARHLTKSTKSR